MTFELAENSDVDDGYHLDWSAHHKRVIQLESDVQRLDGCINVLLTALNDVIQVTGADVKIPLENKDT